MPDLLNDLSCPVCRHGDTQPFLEVDCKRYRRCPQCAARFLEADFLLQETAEKAVYELHDNQVEDPGYRHFLGRLTEVLLPHLKPGSRGLDYGCGPGPALVAMLREQGYEMRVYDPFFAPDESALEQTYDFITCTEVIEHFHQPWVEFRRLDKLLNPGGWLGLMTEFQTDDNRFARWHYRRDPTHVVFYREETLHYLAGQLGWQCEIPRRNVALMHKPDA